jgi:hypothetical protein
MSLLKSILLKDINRMPNFMEMLLLSSNSQMLKSNHKAFICLVLSSLCFVFKGNAQHHISKYEYRWAIWHPFAALKIKKQLPKAMLVYKAVKQQKLLDTLENGGKLDAFRHAYTMAYLARSIKVKKLRKLGKAHEKGNKLQFLKGEFEFGERSDSLSCEMDLRNNDLGFSIGSKHKRLNDQELKELVLNEIIIGKAWYLKRNEAFEYVDCEGNELDLDSFKQKWYVPKCLTGTNF